MKEMLADWGATVAALVFGAVLIGFGNEVFAFRHAIENWARRDLRTQADLAAATLEAPLRTLDFRALQDFHRTLKGKGMILRVRSAQGGWIFHGDFSKGATVDEYSSVGEYRVGVAIPASQVYAPFYRALRGFVLSVLASVSGMFVVFFALYRQRVRIRELARVEKFRREFIADVSHEIKTPLTGILGAVEMLQNGKWRMENEEWREKADGTGKALLGMIGREAKRLHALVQEILDLSRLEREGLALNRTETDLRAIVSDIARRYGVAAKADGDCTAACDPLLIEQALSNLVENAKRHSGTTDITVSLVPSVPGSPVRLIVEDHGVGIPPEHLSRIFDRFHRVDPARAAESGGAGLGLSIVRRIARLHGGDVSCENAVPRGARFVLTLPQEQP